MSCTHPETFNSLCVLCGKVIPRVDPLQLLERERERERALSACPTATGTGTPTGPTGSRSILVNGNVVSVSAAVGLSKLLALQRARRLLLVLDIDHTLLHSVQESGDVFHLPVEEVVDGKAKHLVMKKRPHLDAFLRAASEFCELSVYTAATRRYAEAVVRVLDPDGALFGRRIVTRSDGAHTQIRPDLFCKSLESAFLHEASLAVIIDDREDVWRGAQAQQLLLVRAYQFPFPSLLGTAGGSVREVNNAPGRPSIDGHAPSTADNNNNNNNSNNSNNNADSEAPKCPAIRLQGRPGEVSLFAAPTSPAYTEADDQLLRCVEVLRELHSAYYAELDQLCAANNNNSNNKDNNKDRDRDSEKGSQTHTLTQAQTSLHISRHITAMKQRVLAGYTLCFSGLIPVNFTQPQTHFLWRLAESLGAQVSLELLPRTTHMLATQTDTRKVTQALTQRARDVWVLHPDWLFYCRWSVAHVDERAFMISPTPPTGPLPQPQRCFEPLRASAAANNNHNNNSSRNNSNSRFASIKTLTVVNKKRPRDDESPPPPPVKRKSAEFSPSQPSPTAAAERESDDEVIDVDTPDEEEGEEEEDEEECGVFQSRSERPFGATRSEAVLQEPHWDEDMDHDHDGFFGGESGSESESFPALRHRDEYFHDEDDDGDEDEFADFESFAAFMKKRPTGE